MVKGNIRLNDDSIAFIRDEHDFKDLVHERLGFEAGLMVKELIRAAEGVDSDLRSYEASLESITAGFTDIADITTKLRAELSKERLNRKIIRALVEQIQTEINNHI